MTEDRETANQSSSSETGASESTERSPFDEGRSVPPPGSDDPHPFDRPSDAGERFRGPGAESDRSRQPFGSKTTGDPFQEEAFGSSGAGSLQDLLALASSGQIPLGLVKSWVRENQTATMIGAFALGVFVGAVSRK
ncbi:hypothetical protein CRI94_02490 [Longibacter salinarum]|uniref:Uncharacterized protein n=2 Tax=Longibacter salinarum TaxID=1850348 RepID=A0A2A8D2R8_9BACT|nr:hypothetical protein CRI94_02490 [Longibacter salinarum]